MADKAAQTEQVEQSSGNADSGTAMASRPASAPPRRTPKQLPPYRVLLHNDEVNTFEHVILSVVQLTSVSPRDALVKAIEAHETGVALLLVTHRERAELYAEQFASLQLSVTIEPA